MIHLLSIHLAPQTEPKAKQNLDRGDPKRHNDSDRNEQTVLLCWPWLGPGKSCLHITIIDVHYSLWIQFSNKGIVFFMLMAEAPMKQPVNIGVDIRKVSHNVTWYNGRE